MEFNSFLFPAPRSSYSAQTNLGDLIYIPKYERNSQGDIIPFEKAPLVSSEAPPLKPVPSGLDFILPGQNDLSEPALKLRSVQSIRNLKFKQKTGDFIPCLYLPYLNGSSKLLVYFHGNAEDIGLAMELLNFIKDMLKVSLFILLTNAGARPCCGVPGIRGVQGRL